MYCCRHRDGATNIKYSTFWGTCLLSGGGSTPLLLNKKIFFRHNVKNTFCPLNWILNIYILQKIIYKIKVYSFSFKTILSENYIKKHFEWREHVKNVDSSWFSCDDSNLKNSEVMIICPEEDVNIEEGVSLYFNSSITSLIYAHAS